MWFPWTRVGRRLELVVDAALDDLIILTALAVAFAFAGTFNIGGQGQYRRNDLRGLARRRSRSPAPGRT